MTALALGAPGMERLAEGVVAHALNSLPEGLLIALCAWMLLRLMSRANAGTRFAVWLVALAGVVGLPMLGGLGTAGRVLSAVPHAEVTVTGIWAVVFVALWIPVACVALARVIAGVWQIHTIRESCNEVEVVSLDPALQEAMRQPGMERRVRLLVSDKAKVPAAIGFKNAAIVLPAWCLREMSAEELLPILIHEMAHLRRRDDWTNLLQKLVRAVLFFHPAVWWIDARLSLEREMACDDAVLAATGNARAYAGSLIGLLERGCARRGWKMAQAAVARAREASLRIARILEGRPASTRVKRRAVGVAAALSLTCCLMLQDAPRLVRFSPNGTSTGMQAAARMHPWEPAITHAESHGARVVPAMFHPRVEGRPSLVHRAVARSVARDRLMASSAVPTERVNALKSDPHSAPPVEMARLDEPTPHDRAQRPDAAPTAQMLLVVETAETDYAPADGTQAQGPIPEKAGAQAGAHPVRVQAVEMQAVQVQTVEVVEEDAMGWQVRTYRLVLMVPVAQEGSMQKAI